MRTLWDSSEIKEAAALLNDVLGKRAPSPEPPPQIKPGANRTGHLSRGDQLDESLMSMCNRGKFHGAVLADDSGLPLAVYNSPVDDEVIAAFTSVLGKSLDRTAQLLKQPTANNISMDINYLDKLVLRKFHIKEETYYLMIISPQLVDERAEVELTITHISSILI
jgi:hypothetical protein